MTPPAEPPPRALQRKLRLYRQVVENLGLRGSLRFLGPRLFPQRAWLLTTKQAEHPLVCRARSSDLGAFRQVFGLAEYASLDHVEAGGWIVDAGANVGYSAAYFLSRFPQARVVAVEPDSGNYAALVTNLRPYGTRVGTLRAGIWSHATRLTLEERPYRDGGAWSRQVREARAGEPECFPGVEIGSLVPAGERIALLKMDIEGAEAVVFSHGRVQWLERVDNLAIELHDDSHFGSATTAFHAVVSPRDFIIETVGELTICRRRK
jgi:FkbM family methyltransferase